MGSGFEILRCFERQGGVPTKFCCEMFQCCYMPSAWPWPCMGEEVRGSGSKGGMS